MINDLVIPGLTFGSLYALVAVGINLLYRPTNVLNFAQGDLVMIGAMLMAASAIGRLPWLLAAACVALIVGVLALIEERIAVAPVLRRSTHTPIWVITTLAFSIILSEIAGKVWTDQPRTVAPPAPLSMKTLHVGGLEFSTYQIAVVVFTIAVISALELFGRTRVGCAVRAVAADRDAARLRGINPEQLGRWSFLAGGALAGLTGVLAAPLLLASVTMGFGLLIKGFFVTVVGGVGDFRGALVAGWMLGIVEAAGANYVSPGFQVAILFAAVLVVLMIRPAGLRRTGALRHV